MSDLLVSLIVPAFNVGGYVEQCLDSIRGQTYKNWEAIVVDDGSTDDTGLKCGLFASADHRFKLIRSKRSGVSSARNSALRIAKGAIIGFVDADDYLRTNALELIVKRFNREDISALFTGHSRVNENGKVIEIRTGKETEGNGTEEAIKYTLLPGPDSYMGVVWNKYFARDCIYQNGGFHEFDSRISVGEDQLWLLSVLEGIDRFGTEETALYYYRIRNDSTVHHKGSEAKKSEISARARMVELIEEKHPELADLAKIKYRRCVGRLVKEDFRQGKSLCAIAELSPYAKKYYPETMRNHPAPKTAIKETVLQAVYTLCSVICP